MKPSPNERMPVTTIRADLCEFKSQSMDFGAARELVCEFNFLGHKLRMLEEIPGDAPRSVDPLVFELLVFRINDAVNNLVSHSVVSASEYAPESDDRQSSIAYGPDGKSATISCAQRVDGIVHVVTVSVDGDGMSESEFKARTENAKLLGLLRLDLEIADMHGIKAVQTPANSSTSAP